MHNEIKLRISTANRKYQAISKIFTSKLLSRDTKKNYTLSTYVPLSFTDMKLGPRHRVTRISY